jgi:hypothetical protein
VHTPAVNAALDLDTLVILPVGEDSMTWRLFIEDHYRRRRSFAELPHGAVGVHLPAGVARVGGVHAGGRHGLDRIHEDMRAY